MTWKYAPLEYEKYRPLLVDSTGRRLTSGLFEELADPASTIKPIFRLSEWRKTYVEIGDPTDYHAALVLIGDWEHWQWLLTQCKVFAEHVERWREEVYTKLASEGVDRMREQSKKPTGIAAAKWLAEKGFVAKKMGRPRKVEQDEQPQRADRDIKRLLKVL